MVVVKWLEKVEGSGENIYHPLLRISYKEEGGYIVLESDSGFPWSSRVTNGLECYLLFRIPNLESGFAASLE